VGFPGSACREKEAHEALHRVDRRRSIISRLCLDTHIDGADAAPARLPHLTMMKARSLQRLAFALAAAFIAVAAGTTAYRWSERAGMDELSVGAYHRLDLFAAAIDGIVNRFAHVPSTIQLNPRVRALLRQPDNVALRQTVNEYLEQFNTSIGSIAIFVMSKDGVTLSASNWNRPDSFVGEDLSFRPYYQLARLGIPARYYAIGTTRGEPGYFVSHPINDEGSVVGVAVIKIGLSSLEKQWLPAGVPALIADGNGVVILTSLPEWRLRALAPLNLEQLAEIEYTRQYNREPIGHFPAVIDRTLASQVVALPLTSASHVKGDFLALTRSLPDTGWSLTLFSDLTSVRAQAWIAVALTETGMACVLLSLMFLNQRRRNMRQQLEAQAMLERANASLERKVAERTADLVASNERLHGEVAERQRAEATLRGAQDELVHAAKLAALGQLATGITHELTQPLGALRTLSENAVEYMRRGDQATLEKNLGLIASLVDRMAAIIGPLKTFGRKQPSTLQNVNVSRCVCNALVLLSPRLRQGDVTVVNRCEMELPAWCEPYRLEQVLVNLISNAIDAMADTAAPTLTIEAEKTAAGIVLRVTDTGSGLPQVAHEQLFEPFFTTKAPGEGLGLGLAISRDIVREFGGRLSARNSRSNGAEFVIELMAPPN
jgi:C4-dicarboxylate-specific signal transduction histidine kinase